MSGDVPEHQNHHAFWKIKDKTGWKHGIMVNENRQHWKCKYCSMVGRSGGVSGLKRHLVGIYGKAKKCLAVPDDVSAKIKRLMEDKKGKRKKRVNTSDDGRDKNDLLTPGSDALTGVNTHVPEEATNQTNSELYKTAHETDFIASSEPWDLIPSTSNGLISDVQDFSSILMESAQSPMVLAHVSGGTCYCYFCSLERAAEENPENELLSRTMVQVADMMLSAAQELRAEEQSPTMTK